MNNMKHIYTFLETIPDPHSNGQLVFWTEQYLKGFSHERHESPSYKIGAKCLIAGGPTITKTGTPFFLTALVQWGSVWTEQQSNMCTAAPIKFYGTDGNSQARIGDKSRLRENPFTDVVPSVQIIARGSQ